MRGTYLASVWLHILAAMTWIGGMIVFVTAVMPYFRRRPDAEKSAFLDWFGPRFRRLSWISLAILAVTGAFNLYTRGVRLDDLSRGSWWMTGFGQAFGAKLVLVVFAVAASAAHERLTASRARWLGRSLLLLGLAIVFMAVMMVRSFGASGATAVASAEVQGDEWFRQSGCTACHSVGVYGIRNLAATGPDLSLAVEDVPRRFGRSLDDFLQAPSGTMAMVLSHRIRMTPEERLVAIDKLQEAHRKRSTP